MVAENKRRDAVIQALKKLAGELGHIPRRDEFRKTGLENDLRCEFGSFTEGLNAAGLTDVPVRDQTETDKITSFPNRQELQVAKLKDEISRLKSYTSELESEAVNAHSLRDLIGAIDCSSLGGDSEWLKGAKNSKSSLLGIPTLFLSDIHFDEIVKAEQIGGCNEYNHEIAVKRIQHTFKTTIELLQYHMVSPKYDGIICALGGDNLSGNIHEELAETNEQSINRSIFDLSDLLITGIGGLADEFGKVFVPCVVGNHGRLHKKPRAKNKVYDNFEWLIYQILVRYFKNDARVSFLIPDGSDALFQIYNQRICLTHGDQFKGGTGIAGIFSPLMLGMARKQRRQAAINQSFDIMMMGHFHQLIMMQTLIVNSSVKGYDEYAYNNNFPYERPQQALFINHPDKGINYRMPVLCDGYENKKEVGTKKLIVW